MTEIPSVLRTPKDGCFEFYTGGWGTYLRPIDDPEANVIINKKDLDTFTLKENIHKIPSDLWQRWVQLCFHFVDKVPSTVEVAIRILRSESDPSAYRILVPEQKVTGGSVDANNFNKAIDIETGEVIKSYPPIGWIPVGDSHSHNTMSISFSPVDDAHEIKDPGIHILVKSINTKNRTYQIDASVTAGGRRFIVPYEKILDATPVEDISFHEDVLKYVDYTPPKPVAKTSYFQGNKSWQNRNTTRYLPPAKDKDYKDPFHFQDNYSSDDYEYYQSWLESNYSKPKSKIRIHQVEDILIDYQSQCEKSGDLESLQEYRELLQSYINDIDELIEQPIEVS